MEISAYRLTIIAALVVVVLSVGLVGALGGFANAGPYLTLVGTVAIPSLLQLAKSEANSKKIDAVEVETEVRHVENVNNLEQLRQEILKHTDGGSDSGPA
jgi:hypothetical protein